MAFHEACLLHTAGSPLIKYFMPSTSHFKQRFQNSPQCFPSWPTNPFPKPFQSLLTKVVRVEILRKIEEGSHDRESGDRNTDRKILPSSQINKYMHINSCICIIYIIYRWKNTRKQHNYLINKQINCMKT
jgi:hypothetical protein